MTTEKKDNYSLDYINLRINTEIEKINVLTADQTHIINGLKRTLSNENGTLYINSEAIKRAAKWLDHNAEMKQEAITELDRLKNQKRMIRHAEKLKSNK